MANVLVLGGGICGLGTALLLARDGHEVTVLERDPDPLPASPRAAWDAWDRGGVVQFRQPHNFMPGLRVILESELPDVQAALPRAGAARYDLIHPLPAFAAPPQPIDDQLWTWTARRPAGEWVLADAAAREPRIAVRRGTRVAELLTGPSVQDGIPNVIGARTQDGEEIRADIVIDAMGRRSRGPEWLSAVGARPVYEEQEDCGFTYYTRYFGGSMPERRGPVLMTLGTISLLTLLGDNDTWSVTIFTASADAPLKKLRDVDAFTNVVRACPLQAHWLDGEPITDILPMSGTVDRYRRFVTDGKPVATGFLAVADAWACTNPSAGRGLTVGFKHAVKLRDVLRESSGDPVALAVDFDRATEDEIAPWYWSQIAADRARFAEIEALRSGREPPPPPDDSRLIAAFFAAMGGDADLFRAGLEYVGTITPLTEILSRSHIREKARTAMESMGDAPPPAMPGPNRAQLLELIA